MIDPVEFGKQIGAIVREATGPLLKRIEELEARQPLKGEKGESGQPGNDAPAPTDEQISAFVERYLKANPAKGEKGDAGQNGRDGVDGKDGIAGSNGKDGQDGKAGERGEKGINGNDGRNAEVSYEDIVKAVEDVHERLVAKYVLDLERRGMDAIQRAVDKIPPSRDGKDGINGRDGKDGLSVEGLEREYVPETHEIRERWTAAGVEKELRYPAGGIRGCGYWSEGKKIKAGDAWTHDGALWIALRETSDKPSVSSKDWFIGARKGRDGTDGRNGKDAQPVQLKAASGH